MEKILFISSRYPTKITPTEHVFVQQLVWEMADLGYDCTVISPIAINQNPNFYKLPLETYETTLKDSKIKLFFPRYFSFGQKNILKFNSSKLTVNTFTRAVISQLKKIEEKPSLLYGHFLTPAGICVSRLSRKFGIPGFSAFGESSSWSIDNFGIKEITEELKFLSGIISVSTKNKKLLDKYNVYPTENIEVFVNGYREDRFYPRNKELSRKKFGFNKNDFIVGYVGSFNTRKGSTRLSAALKGIPDIKIAYAGSGKKTPAGENVIFCERVKPEEMPFFLSSLDLFVLPSLNEGCSNAIIEAMACGLPIISSDLDFNYDILDKNNSILVDPMNEQEIRNAVLTLKDNKKLRYDMSNHSIKKAVKLTLSKRATNISKWMRKKAIEKY